MKAYKLLKDIPGVSAGAVFLHDKKDSVKGSVGYGCLKLAWDLGGCQGNGNNRWCAETHIFPGQLAKDREWFIKIKNKKRYTLQNIWLPPKEAK